MNATEKMFHTLQDIIEKHDPQDDSLLGGRLGLAVYYFTLYQLFNEDRYAEKALDLVQTAAELQGGSDNGLFGANFSAGGAGLCSVIHLLHTAGLLDMDPDEELAELDDYLYNTALTMIKDQGNLDYLHGAAGIIFYFVRRMPNARVEPLLQHLVNAFLEKKINTPQGTWFSTYVMETDDRTEINFSLSHGQTSFLIILMQAYEKGIRLPEIKTVVETGINLLLAFRRQPDRENKQHSFFPSTVKSQNPEEILISNRLAWCYGDLNIILLLYEAARFLQKPEWKLLADELGKASLYRRSTEETAITDSHFCHGSAGLVFYYNRLFAISPQEGYREAAAFWLQETVNYVEADLAKNTYAGKECALLEGLVGVNLALAGAMVPATPEWPRLLLL